MVDRKGVPHRLRVSTTQPKLNHHRIRGFTMTAMESTQTVQPGESDDQDCHTSTQSWGQQQADSLKPLQLPKGGTEQSKAETLDLGMI